MTRDEALELVKEFVKNENLVHHMLAVESAMVFYAETLGEPIETWSVTGLLHDFDWEIHPTAEQHPAEGEPILRARGVPEEIIQAILAQLSLLYEKAAGHPVKIYYQDWAKEEFTATEYDQWSAHNHPEFQPPSGKTSIWDDTFHFAGTETADHFGGYLEGALSSAERAVARAI